MLLRFSFSSHVQSINVVRSSSSLIIKKSIVNFIVALFVKSFHRYSNHEKPTGNLIVKIVSVPRKIN